MLRNTCLAAALVLVAGAPWASAEPVKLARHPDYHMGRIVFSYLGDIWIAGEDGSSPTRLTDNLGHDLYPRFSPDGRWVAFSSNRYGNNDVFVVPVTGGMARRLTFHTGNDEVVDWTRDSQRVVFRAAHGDGAFPNVNTLYEVSVTGGPEQPLPVDWGYFGAYSPDGRQLVFNRHPSTWTRRHYRGSYAADLWIVDLSAKTYRELLPGELYNRYWPMWAPDGSIYYVADPLPNDRSVKPGSPQVYRSVSNIYKIAATGAGQPAQVTRHTSGSLYWPSMSADGKVIVYEESFGLWKLDVATGRSTEIRIDITAEPKVNETVIEEVENEVDSFDLSPSGRRAVISARGQILTIATERGDITRVAPDKMASRNRSPTWSPDGRHLAFVSDREGSDEIWVSDPDGANLTRVTSLNRETAAMLWTPDSKGLLYAATDRNLYRYSVDDGQTRVVATGEVAPIGSVAVSPDSQFVSFVTQDRTARSHVYIVPMAGGTPRHITTDRLQYSETDAAWTANGRYLVFVTSEGVSGGAASQGGVATTMGLWMVALTDRERDPLNRDVDNEAQAAALGRQGGGARAGGPGGAPVPPPVVTIDWESLPERATPIEIPGTSVSGLTASPDGRSVAVRVGTAGGGRGGRGGGGAAGSGLHVLNTDTGQLSPVPSPPPAAGGGGRGGRGGGGGFGGGSDVVFSRDGRTLYFRQGNSLYAAGVGGGGGAAGAAASAAPAGRGGRGGRGGTADAAPASGGGPTVRQVTYTAYIESDRRALRRQVFNEGWRVMKNRFYDPKMHGVDWAESKGVYEPLLDHLVNTEELHTVMMMMIGQLNASHTGVSGGPPNPQAQPLQTRYPGFDVVADSSGYYRVGHIYETGPADRDYLNIREGHYIIALNGEPLRTSDSYWQRFTITSGTKFHFLINDTPSADGARAVTIEPLNGGAFGDLQYARWVEDRRQMVERLSSGEVGYLHIRAMNAPSLRQFQLDLAANRTKRALVIDQRFNGGGGIDQELLAILSGRAYQFTVRRDSDVEVPRPQNFYGPMVVMQNERSASDAEMFPAGFKALGLGKVIGVPTMGAVIGTGSYALLDGSTIRTPGTGVWTSTQENMENYGVPPDELIDNTPNDFIKGRDAQIEKAVEVLKAELVERTGQAGRVRRVR
jgi:tricorn protease